jgi:hypothetical protein
MSRGKLGFVNENFLPIWGATVCGGGGGWGVQLGF